MKKLFLILMIVCLMAILLFATENRFDVSLEATAQKMAQESELKNIIIDFENLNAQFFGLFANHLMGEDYKRRYSDIYKDYNKLTQRLKIILPQNPTLEEKIDILNGEISLIKMDILKLQKGKK